MDVIDRELAHLDNLLQERADAAAKIAQKLRHLAGEMDVLHKSQADSQQALSASTRSSARLEAKIAEARTNVEQARALMEEAVETAEAVSPRLRVDESKEVLQKKLGKLQQQLEQARRLPGFDRDAAEEAYLAAREKVDRAVNSLNSLWFLHRSLTAALDDRRRRWFEMRTQLVSSARMSFQMLMYQKTGKAASLKFKYENLRPNEAEELGIHVDFGHEGKKKAKKIGLEQRSGGERSMTQLYFMMSCWEGAETPFRALDEFNVFLDPSNDAIALETLVNSCHVFLPSPRPWVSLDAVLASAFADHALADPSRAGQARPRGQHAVHPPHSPIYQPPTRALLAYSHRQAQEGLITFPCSLCCCTPHSYDAVHCVQNEGPSGTEKDYARLREPVEPLLWR